jgi:hypothetical protein
LAGVLWLLLASSPMELRIACSASFAYPGEMRSERLTSIALAGDGETLIRGDGFIRPQGA